MFGGFECAGRTRASVDVLRVWRVRQFVFDSHVNRYCKENGGYHTRSTGRTGRRFRVLAFEQTESCGHGLCTVGYAELRKRSREMMIHRAHGEAEAFRYLGVLETFA